MPALHHLFLSLLCELAAERMATPAHAVGTLMVPPADVGPQPSGEYRSGQ